MSAIKNIKSIVPLLDRVLIQRFKPETKTASGIYIPEKNAEKLSRGTVIAVGPGFVDSNGNTVKPHVQPGDSVLLPAFGGSVVKVGEEQVELFRDSEILAKISE